MSQSGKVYLVGAGPGDPDLITVKGLAVLKSADVIIYDRLAPAELLLEAKPDAELINAGKSRGASALTQAQINEKMISLAREGKTVCRLKGGDPFVFGRGGEEGLALSEAGVEWALIPGVTSAIAAPAYSGIPVTHRGVAGAVTIVTGSEDPENPNGSVNWENVAKSEATLVVLMGVGGMAEITELLIRNGKPPDTPAAVTENGSLSNQKTVTGAVADIARLAVESGIKPPATLTVGDVVALRDKILRHPTPPLAGKRIVVTRARSQASSLSRGLKDLGATVIECPVIKVLPLDDTTDLDKHITRLGSYEWIAFASPNSVKQVWRRLKALGLDTRALSSSKIAAVGPTTSKALGDRGIDADLVPRDFTSEGLVQAFARFDERPKNALAFKSDIGGETLPDGLRSLGADVDEVAAYRNVLDPQSSAVAAKAYSSRVDATTFTSSSTVKNLVAVLSGDVSAINDGRVVCIGPRTAATANENGIRVDALPEKQSILSLIDTLRDILSDDQQR